MPAPRCSAGGLPRSERSPILEQVFDDQVLRELRRKVAAVSGETTVSIDDRQVLPVAEPLAAVLPRGGVARGSVVSVVGQGATSLLFTLLAGPEAPWSALVGMPGVGLLAAAEFGIDLDRVVVIPEPGPDVLQVLSILIDGVDMIAVALPPGLVPVRRASGYSPVGSGSTARCCW